MKHLGVCVALALALAACKSDKKSEGGATGGDKAAKPASGLEMSSSSPTCKKAMTCCEARVKDAKGALNPEDVNLMCSGVALATTDADCEAFQKGYVAEFEAASKPVPAACQ